MVDQRRRRTPQPLLWALAGAVLIGMFVFVLAVAPWLLIPHPYNGLTAAEELKALNDVRATLVQALAGLAVAGGLIVTYRTYRQNQAEQDRTYRLNRAEQNRALEREIQNRAEQDRTYERELYARAVEQLGHEKAPVRLGALYSLERLAQDKPERRQVIVDVICAYLRMPFSPTAPAEKPEPEAAVDRGEPASGTRTDGNSDTWRQERQVRFTAQRILAEHVRDGRAKDKRSTDPPSPHFWPETRLDLAGATLIDFKLESSVMAQADFSGATFSGDAYFNAAAFSGSAWFYGAVFSGDAYFNGAAFSGGAGFGGAVFRGNAGFRRATFDGAYFDGAAFSGNAWFNGAAFSSDAGFRGATFRGGAMFEGAIFSGIAEFREATFSGGENSLSFDRSDVRWPDAAHVWPTGWCPESDGKGGCTVVRANGQRRPHLMRHQTGTVRQRHALNRDG